MSQLVPAPACNADSGPATPSTGNRISNVVPRPCSLSSVIVPPWRSAMIARAIARP